MATTGSEGLPPLPSLQRLEALTDPQALSLLLDLAERHQRQSKEKLRGTIREHEALEERLEAIEALPTKLRSLQQEGLTLGATVNQSSQLAEALSARVRAMDLIRRRLRETIRYLDDRVDVQSCSAGLKEALGESDLEKAAGYVKKYRGMELNSLEDEGAASQVQEVAEGLLLRVKEKLQIAMNADAKEEVLRLCKLLQEIGHGSLALQLYCEWVQEQLRAVCQKIVEAMRQAKQVAMEQQVEGVDKSKLGFREEEKLSKVYVDSLTKLLRCVGEKLKEHQECQQIFGDYAHLIVLRALVGAVDKYAAEATRGLRDIWYMDEVVAEISKRERYSEQPVLVHGREMDVSVFSILLHSLALIAQRYELFRRFVHSKLDTAKNGAKKNAKLHTPDSTSPLPPSSPSSYRLIFAGSAREVEEVEALTKEITESFSKSLFTETVLLMLQQYNFMEEHHIMQSLRRAVKMNHTTPDSKTSTIVDNVFFVLQECMRRALSSGNMNVVCAIANIIKDTLSDDFKKYLVDELQENASQEEDEDEGDEGRGKGLMVVLNNMEVSGQYIVKLRQVIEEEVKNVFQDRSLDTIRDVISDLNNTAKSFEELLRLHLEQLSSTVEPSVRPVMQVFATVSYDLSEEQFAERGAEDTFIPLFLERFSTMLRPFEKYLTTANFEHLLHFLMVGLVKKLEANALKKKYSHLGGMQFDKDLRAIISYFSARTPRPVRVEFARLLQISMLLGLESPDEVLEYWGENSGDMTWRLSPSEVRNVLSRRKEFTPLDISQLAL